MKTDSIKQHHTSFEDAAYIEGDITYWFARDLQALLEYTKWDNFLSVVLKAKASCETSGHEVSDHFADVGKMIKMPKGASKEIADIMLTRYACYVIAQNGDPRKESIAFAQSYFAIQTRKHEILEERMLLAERVQARAKLTETEKQLSDTLFEHGVDARGFGEIRSRGDNALFGGHNTAAMEKQIKKYGFALDILNNEDVETIKKTENIRCPLCGVKHKKEEFIDRKKNILDKEITRDKDSNNKLKILRESNSVKITHHAIDQLSKRLIQKWILYRNDENEGLVSWIRRTCDDLLDSKRIKGMNSVVKDSGVFWVFRKKGREYILTTVYSK